jgi:hypothetical protein
MTLVGFVKDDSFNIYSSNERIMLGDWDHYYLYI